MASRLLAAVPRASIKVIVVYGSLALSFRTYVGSLDIVHGPSMLPTFETKAILVSERMSVHSNRVAVGDVVTARSVVKPNENICKRVLGLEGDLITVPAEDPRDPPRTIQVPPGHVWLQGDNLLYSRDSRTFGPVPYALLKGRAFCQLWPRMRMIPREVPDGSAWYPTPLRDVRQSSTAAVSADAASAGRSAA